MFDRLRRAEPGLQITEDELNRWGGTLLDAGQTRQAVAVFALNVRLHPDSATALDSLAMGYEAADDPVAAVTYYSASLRRDPANDHAVARLSALRTGKR